MNYFIQEVKLDKSEHFLKTAWSKARIDIDSIMERMGFSPIVIISHEETRKDKSIIGKIIDHKNIGKEWKNALNSLCANDTLFIQIPVFNHSIFLPSVLNKLRKRNIRVVLFVHDLELIRYSLLDHGTKLSKIRNKIEEKGLIRESSMIILHNNKMIEFVENMGVPKSKMVNLQLFDYLYDKHDNKDEQGKLSLNNGIIIAGNLSKEKSEYLYHLPDDIHFHLYGVNYEDKPKDNINYHGSYAPDDLPNALFGSFGLVWDGNSVETCQGVYGDYLRINNPHKISLYLAAGMPVFIWKEAALAELVKKYQLGICIDSIHDIKGYLDDMSESEYKRLRRNVSAFSNRLIAGEFTKTAIESTLIND